MANIPFSGEATKKLSSMQQIDGVCDAYESDLSAGNARPMKDYVDRVDKALAPELMRELSLLHRDAEELLEESSGDKSTGAQATLTRFEVSNLRLRSRDEDCFRFENYLLLEKIGSGASGVVYLAEDIDLRKRYALKLSHAEDCVDNEGFIREARNTVRLDHRGIVRMLRVGVWRKTPFIVTEFVPGVNLKSWLLEHREKLEFRQIAELVAEIADALQHAHEQQVVHRDIKPSNIVVKEELVVDEVSGKQQIRLHPCIMDFGISKVADTINSRTLQGDIIGTPAYMSPEQAGGGSVHADHRMDIYGLGVVLYELLSGSIPFRGTTAQVLAQIQNGAIPPLHTIAPSVPKPLMAICHQCLKKDPKARYASAKALADDLRSWLNGMPVIAKSPIPNVWMRCQSVLNNRVAILAGFIALGALAGYGIWRDSDAALISRGLEQAKTYKKPDAELIEFVTTGVAKGLPELVRSLEIRPGFLAGKMKELYQDKPPVIRHDPQGEASVREYARIVYTLFLLGDHDVFWANLRSDPDPRMRSYLIDLLADTGRNMLAEGFSLDPLFVQLQRETDPIAQYALILAIGYQDRESFTDESRIVEWIKGAYLAHGDSGVHSACLWFLARRGEADFLIHANDQLSREGMVANRNWHVSPTGILFVHCQTPEQFYVGTTRYTQNSREKKRLGKAARKFAMSAFQAPVELQDSYQETSGMPLGTFNEDLPIISVSATVALRICNWLSNREGFLASENAVQEKANLAFDMDLGKAGYRLPSDSEYEFAAEANSVTELHFGSIHSQFQKVKFGDKSDIMSISTVPNAFGFFGFLNATHEWTCTPMHIAATNSQQASIDLQTRKALVLCGITWSGPEHWRRGLLAGSLSPELGSFRICRTLK